MYDIIKSKCINIFVKVQILKTLSLNGVAFKSKRKPPDLQILVLVNWQFHFVKGRIRFLNSHRQHCIINIKIM